MTGRHCATCWAEITSDGGYCRNCADAKVIRERDEANALLRDCHAVIWNGCASEDARPCRSDLIPLLRRIEAALPDLAAEPAAEPSAGPDREVGGE